MLRGACCSYEGRNWKEEGNQCEPERKKKKSFRRGHITERKDKKDVTKRRTGWKVVEKGERGN